MKPFSDRFNSLFEIAKKSLEANIVTLKQGKYLRAGGHQFQALWTRDFCFATRGLWTIQRQDVVRDQLELLLRAVRNKDLLVPKYFDSVPILWRYITLTFGKIVPINDGIKPGYFAGLPPNASVDSNALVALAALDYAKRSGDSEWFKKHEQKIIQILSYYDSIEQDGLVFQESYSDWQDSVKRTGRTFLTNLLVWKARVELGADLAKADLMKRKIELVFKDVATGLYLSISEMPQISLEGNLLAIDLGFVIQEQATALYKSLKDHPLWNLNGFPGFATYPDYPSSQIAPIVKAVGVRHYHDRVIWSWLMGLSAKVARLAGDESEATRILDFVQAFCIRDQAVFEIYDEMSPFKPFKAWMYQSEAPFSWGAGMILDALNQQVR